VFVFQAGGRPNNNTKMNGEISSRRHTKSQMCPICDLFSLCKNALYKNKIPFTPLTRKSAHLFGKGKKEYSLHG
jgi:hypothetical protein